MLQEWCNKDATEVQQKCAQNAGKLLTCKQLMQDPMSPSSLLTNRKLQFLYHMLRAHDFLVSCAGTHGLIEAWVE